MATIQEVAEKFDVTPDQVKQLKSGMQTTWIRSDTIVTSSCRRTAQRQR